MAGKQQVKAVAEGKLVETTNSLAPHEFAERYFSKRKLKHLAELIADSTGRVVSVSLLFAEALGKDRNDVLDACFKLVEESSASDYKASEMKWSPAKKRKEMILPDMRYLVVYSEQEIDDTASESSPQSTSTPKILGFVSFMFTYEDGYEVVYVYEIHLGAQLRGQGVGTLLMELVEDAAKEAGVSKCMLTVFKTNQKAVRWYDRCGYTVDDFSPGPRVLRNGSIKEPSYLILSKSMAGNTQQARTASI